MCIRTYVRISLMYLLSLLSIQEGQADTPALLGLSRKYSEKFKVKVEDTYNIIMEIWRGRKEAEVNLKSVFSPEVQVRTYVQWKILMPQSVSQKCDLLSILAH